MRAGFFPPAKWSGNWALPGGAVDIGETFAQSAIREVKEETGFDIRIDRIIGIYADPGHVLAYDDGELRQEFSICGLPVHAPQAQRAAQCPVGSSPNRSARSQWVIRCRGQSGAWDAPGRRRPPRSATGSSASAAASKAMAAPPAGNSAPPAGDRSAAQDLRTRRGQAALAPDGRGQRHPGTVRQVGVRRGIQRRRQP